MIPAGSPRRWAALVLTVALPAVATTPRAEDTVAHASVVLLRISTRHDGRGHCTAVVVSPHVLLTAAHCVALGSVGRGATFEVFTGTDVRDPAQATDPKLRVPVAWTMAHPGFDAGYLPGGFDLGVVVTERALGLPPLPIERGGAVPKDVEVVGFGAVAPGVRQAARYPVAAADKAYLDLGRRGDGACHGDSGAPALAPPRGRRAAKVVAIVSYGLNRCAGGVRTVRVAPLAPFVDATVARDRPDAPPVAPAAGAAVTAPIGAGSL